MSGSDHGRSEFSTGRVDRDRCPGCNCREAWRAALVWATSDEEEALDGWEEAEGAFERWHAAQTQAGNQSLDGVHSRQAQEEALSGQAVGRPRRSE